MTEFEINVVKLVLKEISDACKKTNMCKDCQFSKSKQLRADKVWFDCRICREPHFWDLEEEGAE